MDIVNKTNVCNFIKDKFNLPLKELNINQQGKTSKMASFETDAVTTAKSKRKNSASKENNKQQKPNKAKKAKYEKK